MNHSTPSLPVHYQLLEFTQTHLHWVGDAIQPSHPLSPLLLPSIFPSIKVFSNESALRIRWPNYWNFSFNISPSNEHPGLIFFRIDWLDLLAVQGTLKGLLQHHSSKASIFLCSAFFILQFSHPYMTIGKTIALTRWTLVGIVMSLLFNMLSMLVIIMAAITICSDFGAQKNKVSHGFHCFPIYLPWSDGHIRSSQLCLSRLLPRPLASALLHICPTLGGWLHIFAVPLWRCCV